MNRALKCAALCAALATAAGPASAAVQLRITDGTPAGTILVNDQGVGDFNPDVGVVSYTGPVGTQWSVNFTTATSKPAIGSATAPEIDLNSINVSSSAGGTLLIEITDTDFTGSGPSTVSIGGVASGTVTLKSYVDFGNAPFGKTTAIATQGPFSGGSFANNTSGSLNATAPYSMSLELQIAHPVSGRTGLDAHFYVTAPQVSCPTNATVRCNGSLDPDVNTALGKPVYTGATICAPLTTMTYSDAITETAPCSKTILRTWTIIDGCDVTNYCTQVITVSEDVAPVLTVPANVTVECNGIPPVGIATGSDNCDANVLVSYLGQTRVDGQNPACSYSLIRTWKAVDSCGNAVTNSQNILVRDTTAPVLTVPANITVECGAVPVPGSASATDVCDANPAVTYLGAMTNASGCGYVITRKWKAADLCGNAVTNSQIITVRDITAPVLTVPASVTVECSAIPTPGTPSARDNCDASPVITYLGQVSNGSGCNYTITRKWKAADACGNAVTNSQLITVRDTTAPVINSVPAGGEIGCVALPSDATIKSQVTASDNCGTVTINVTHVDSGTACSTNRVFTITATDGCNTTPARTVSYTATCGGGQVCSTFNFNGSSALSGTFGNIRLYTNNGVIVKASAFSRNRTDGVWAAAYLGAYGGGLGVTDNTEGTGDNNTHTTDNIDRDNYVLFEFSQPVTVSSATLGFVVNDSDLSLFVGTFADPFNNHLNLSDAVLAGFGFTEENLTTLTTTRTAALNAGGVTGNAIIIAADVLDTTPEDMFKIQLLNICTAGSCVTNPPATGGICGSVLRDCDNNASLTGEAGLGGWTVTLKDSAGATVATKVTDSYGNYCFTNVAAGSYCVVVTPMASYAQTVDPDTTLDSKTCFALAAGQNKTGVNFGYTGTAPSVNIVMTGPATAKCGDTITYSICVTNTGNTCVYGGLEVQDPLLGGQVFHQTPVAPGQGFCFTKTYVIPASYSGTLVNTATAIGHPPGLAAVTKVVSVSTTVTCDSTPCPPTPCLSVKPGCNLVNLSWYKCDGATSYNLKRSFTKDGAYVTIRTGLTTTNYTDSTVTNGTAYCYKVVGVKNGVEGNACEPKCAIPYILGTPWAFKDIGATAEVGGSTLTSGTFTILGSGVDIWDTGDEFQFAYQSGSGDCTVVARVTAVGNSNPWAKAGVMIRESLTPGSKHAFMCLTPGNGAAFQSRSATGGSSLSANTAGLTAPYWVKVTRVGNVFTGYASPNGTTWTQIGQQTIPMTVNVSIGLAVTSHNDGVLCTATFQNVTATP